MADVEQTTIAELMSRFSVLLFDAYGVLVHSQGAMPGAARLIATLNRAQTAYYVLTNDAARLPGTAARYYQSCGLNIGEDRVITAGSLLQPYFRKQALVGRRCRVLGPADSIRYVELAGGIVSRSPGEPFDILVLADERGFPFLDTIDATLSALYRKLDHGEQSVMVLPNPDLVYPKGADDYGIAAGSVALIVEAALSLRYGRQNAPHFVRLGKPYAPLFEEAARRSHSRDMVLIGDQLDTDIAGACQFGIASALVTFGITYRYAISEKDSPQPTYTLNSLAVT